MVWKLSTQGLEEQAADRCERAGGGLWYDQFLQGGDLYVSRKTL